MKKLFVILAVSVLLYGFAGSAMALSFGTSSDGTSLQQVFDGFTLDGTSSVNTLNDYLAEDAYWQQTATGGSVVTMVIEVAGFKDTNTFGIYDAANHNVFVELFNGLASPNSLNDQITFSIRSSGEVKINGNYTGITFSGSTFGFYLDSTNGGQGGGRFYSDTSLNSDLFDHLAVYQGTGDWVQLPGYNPGEWTSNEYILAWEDLYGGGDSDYQDFVVMAESINPAVPEPSTVLLLGAGMLGLVAFGRKHLKK